MPYATEPEATNIYGDGLSALTLELIRGVSARTVADLSKAPPDPMTDDYRKAARDAELLVGNYLVANGFGTLTSTSLSGVGSDSFASLDEVKKLAASALGSYYSGGAGKAYISSFPFSRG